MARRTKRRLLVQIAVLCTLAQFASPGYADTIVFSDNFDGGVASGLWGQESGSWRATDGVYDVISPNNNPLTYSGVSSLTSLTDFVVQVDINDLDDGGIWLRSNHNSGSINGVLLVTGGFSGSYNGLYWHILKNGQVSTVLNAESQAGLQGSDVSLRVEVIGNTYSAFLNGSSTALTTLESTLFTSGSVGLYDFSPVSGSSSPRGQTFDNFTVIDLTSEAVPEPSSFVALAGLSAMGLVFMQRRRKRTC